MKYVSELVASREKVELLIDGHVHCHARYDQDCFLTTACRNLESLGEGIPTLLFAEKSGDDIYKRWHAGGAPWAVNKTKEPESLLLGDRLLVIAGRQIVTKEGVEVLALLTDKYIPDREPLDTTLRRIKEIDALSVLPWGVGKWVGLRGKLVEQAASEHGVFLGDNLGRPSLLSDPKLFSLKCVLPGSDPLRLKSQETSVGKYGFSLQCHLDLDFPAESIKYGLRSLEGSPQRLGRRVSLAGFVKQQVGIRIFK